jgi:hypothetical protein
MQYCAIADSASVTDLELMKQHMAFGQKIVAQEPFKSAILKQVYPEAGITGAGDHRY